MPQHPVDETSRLPSGRVADLVRVGRLAEPVRSVLRDRDVVITGPTGWIGSAFVALLNELHGPQAAERVHLFGSRSSTLSGELGGHTVRPLSSLTPADIEGRIVIHLAYQTKDKLAVLSAADYAARNLEIDGFVLEAMKAARPAGVFVASSGAARDAERGTARDLYALLKLAQEDTFLRAGEAAGIPILPARIFNISGPFGNKPELYALSNFILQGKHSGRIQINAPVLVYRSFIDVMDLVAVALASLAAGRGASAAVDFAGPHVVEMQEIAEAAASAVNLSPACIVRPSLDATRVSTYLGEPAGFASLCVQAGIRPSGFQTQVLAQASWLQNAPPLNS